MKKKDIVTLAVGMALGAMLTGGAFAAGIVAEPAWSPIYVDGKQVQMTAYNIAGNNYVKLRDIGQAVGFNVYYQNGVQVDSDAPYTGEAPAIPSAQTSASPAGTLQVSSMKGTELAAGDRSSLLISPAGTNYTAVSSDPAVVSLEQVAGYWVAVAQSPGTAAVTVTDSGGRSAVLDLTVAADASAEIDLNANMELRLEIVRLVNEVRRENGLAELPINEALMNAAQDCSAQCFPDHRPYESLILPKYGWPYGALYNMETMGRSDLPRAAELAVLDWTNSPGHLQTMLKENAACIGTGVTSSGGRVYCYMAVGSPNWINAYT